MGLMSWALDKEDDMKTLGYSQTLSIALTRVFAVLALAVAVLLPGAGAAAAADGYTTAQREIQAEGYWQECGTADGVRTCTSTMIEVLGVDARSTIKGHYEGERACVFIITNSLPASMGDVSAQGGDGGGGESSFEYGCAPSDEAIRTTGLAMVSVTPLTIPLTELVCTEFDCSEVHSRDVTISAVFDGTGAASPDWGWHDRDPWFNDGCFQVDNSASESRRATVEASVDGETMADADLLWGFLLKSTFNYTETCR
jgi:hypothetical protein